MGPGDSRPLGSEPCSLEPHHIYLVSWQQNLLCCMKSASCVPGHVSHFIDYFKLSLLLSCTRAVIQLEVVDPHMPWENILVCAQAAFQTCTDLAFRDPQCFSLVQQGMTTPMNQPSVLFWVMLYLTIFCFYSFPMVIFSQLSQSNRWLLTLAVNQHGSFINCVFVLEQIFEIMLILTGSKSTCKRRLSC